MIDWTVPVASSEFVTSGLLPAPFLATMQAVLRNMSDYATKVVDEAVVACQPGHNEAVPWPVYKHGTFSEEERRTILVEDEPLAVNPVLHGKFAMMQRFFHVGTVDTPACGQPGFDPCYEVQPVLDSVNLMFKKYFVPLQHISIDESMVGMKNCVAYLQYMPNKNATRDSASRSLSCVVL